MATFEDVLRAEKKELQGVRDRTPKGTRLPGKTVGLAFSGGGIRSATFHLGVLQGLAEYGLLKQVDYLSTVSGGGYIGSWLARWIREQGIEKVEATLPGGAEEAPEVNFLRDYSNYLTPRVGLLGADTWAAITLYLRNLLLNQAVLIAFLSGILVIPWIVSATFAYLQSGYYDGTKLLVFSIVAAILLIIAIAVGVLNTSTCGGGEQPKFAQAKCVLVFVVMPLFAGAVLLSYALWSYPAEWTLSFSILAGMIVYTAGHLAGWTIARIANPGDPPRAPEFSNVVWALPAGIFAGYEVYGLSFIVYRWKAAADPAMGAWHAVSWGTPLVVVAFLLAGTLHTGLAKFALRNEMQEWWARLGGWLMLWALFWSALFGLALFAPWVAKGLLHYAWAKRAAAVAWVVHSGYGALLGWSKATSGKSPGSPNTTDSPVKEIVAKTAPLVFVTGLLALLACAVESLAVTKGAVNLTTGKYQFYWFAGAFTILIAMSLFLSWRVDINRFSMNLLYRNRIIRCYLGASNPKREPQPFTGFDPTDDIFLASFVEPPQQQKGTHSGSSNEMTKTAQPYNGPYPILNATLDISHGGRLAWQERKAEAFVFTPHYCGYEFPEMRPEINRMEKHSGGAYQETGSWALARGGISLGTAVSISGAAVSPNMGYHTYAPLAFLMTVFNVRLGVWLANPRYSNHQYRQRPDGGPAFSLLYLINELLGTATDSSKYAYLSDGAHFENLALYELVRRECDFIIAGDAGEDPGPGFEDLVNAIRKCRTDLGAEIELNTAPFKISGSDGYAAAHAVFGTIKYPGKKQGKLLYVKSSLTEKDPADVLAYKRTHGAFPQQSTADQWFDESQFESYRMLGRCSIQSIIPPGKDAAVRSGGVPALFS
jgi:predicted acylesterase/phospholipase RssA